jgi:hypothetical protein
VPVAYLYVLGASTNPNRVECAVPWRVDDDEIFFGPCKIPLREKLRPELLGPDTDRAVPRDDIYFVGFNALGVPRARKLVWAGRMREAMSFAQAWIELDGPRYEKMRDESGHSPVHLVPLDGSGRPTGYRQRGKEHLENGDWVSDVVDDELRAGAVVSGRDVRLLPHKTWWTGFSRDICFRFENLFFATEGGLDIDEQLVKILADAQPDRVGVDSLAIFGINAAGDPDGRRGGWLELRGDHLERFVAWLGARLPPSLRGHRAPGATVPSVHRTPNGCR